MRPPDPSNDSAPENERKASAARIRPVLVIRCRADGVLTFVNENYCRCVGRTRAQLEGHKFWALLPMRERQRGRRHVKALTPADPAASIEYVLESRPGRVRRQRWMDHARFDDDGRLVEWLATGEELIAEHPDWLTEASLQAAILCALPDPFILFSARGDYLEMHAPQNGGGHGLPPVSILGQNIRDVMPPPIAERLQAAFDRTLATGEISTLEYALEDEDGKRVVQEARVARCTPGLLIALIRDRTEERQTTQALGRAEAQTRDLQQEIALLGQVASLGVLAGSIAHELNQPLMSSATNAQAALKFLSTPTPDLVEARAALTDIGVSIKRLKDMVRHLLDRLKHHATAHLPLDLNALVSEVVRLVGRHPRARGVTLDAQLAAGLPRVSGDRIQLQQVVLNLLLNACDAVTEANGPGGPRVVVRTERERDGGSILVSVIDSGVGIPAADLARVFEPFYTTKAHGTGLGLPISRTILALHGARLNASPNLEGGMTFSFMLAPAVRQGQGSQGSSSSGA